MTQKQLADVLRMSQSTVASYEVEGGNEPTLDTFGKIAAALGCSFAWLVCGSSSHAHAGRKPGRAA